jgi:hypothetical protein
MAERSKKIFIGRAPGFDTVIEAEDSSFVRTIRGLEAAGIEPIYSTGFRSTEADYERIENSSAMIADFFQPDPNLSSYALRAYKLGKPVLLFAHDVVPTRRILGAGVSPLTGTYASHDTPGVTSFVISDTYFEDPSIHIDVYRGTERTGKLVPWLRQHNILEQLVEH